MWDLGTVKPCWPLFVLVSGKGDIALGVGVSHTDLALFHTGGKRLRTGGSSSIRKRQPSEKPSN